MAGEQTEEVIRVEAAVEAAETAAKTDEVESGNGEAEEQEVFRPGRLPKWFIKREQEEEALAKSRVIDIPMRWGPGMPAPVDEELERCSYVGPTDRKCGRPVTEKGMCRIHARWERWTAWGWPMTCPEDRDSVQEVLRQAMSFFMAGHITEKQALTVVAICRAILRAL